MQPGDFCLCCRRGSSGASRHARRAAKRAMRAAGTAIRSAEIAAKRGATEGPESARTTLYGGSKLNEIGGSYGGIGRGTTRKCFRTGRGRTVNERRALLPASDGWQFQAVKVCSPIPALTGRQVQRPADTGRGEGASLARRPPPLARGGAGVPGVRSTGSRIASSPVRADALPAAGRRHHHRGVRGAVRQVSCPVHTNEARTGAARLQQRSRMNVAVHRGESITTAARMHHTTRRPAAAAPHERYSSPSRRRHNCLTTRRVLPRRCNRHPARQQQASRVTVTDIPGDVSSGPSRREQTSRTT